MKDIITVKDLKVIPVEGGDVKHFLRSDEKSFNGFGEAYFSFIEKGKIKGWKLHSKMTMNLVVPIGEVGFVFYIEEKSIFQVFRIGNNNYKRLTVPPNIWFGFLGLEDENTIINFSNIIYDDNEVIQKKYDENYDRIFSKKLHRGRTNADG